MASGDRPLYCQTTATTGMPDIGEYISGGSQGRHRPDDADEYGQHDKRVRLLQCGLYQPEHA